MPPATNGLSLTSKRASASSALLAGEENSDRRRFFLSHFLSNDDCLCSCLFAWPLSSFFLILSLEEHSLPQINLSSVTHTIMKCTSFPSSSGLYRFTGRVYAFSTSKSQPATVELQQQQHFKRSISKFKIELNSILQIKYTRTYASSWHIFSLHPICPWYFVSNALMVMALTAKGKIS